MTIKGTCIGATLGALAAGASWALRPADDGAGAAAVAPEPRALAPARIDGVLGDASPPTSSAARSVAAVEAEAALDPLFGIVCHGRVVDGAGAGVAGARRELEGSDGALTSVTSDDAGGWSTFGLAAGPYALGVRADGYLTRNDEVEVPAAREWRHDVVLTEARSIPVRFEDPSGAPLADGGLEAAARFLGVAASRAEPGARLSAPGRAVHASETARYRSRAERSVPPDLGERYQGLLQLTAAPPLWVAAAYRDVVLEARRIDGRERELVFVVDPARFAALAGTVRVRFVDRDTGEALTQGVTLGHPSGGVRVAQATDGDTLVFAAAPPGALDLELFAPGYERVERAVEVVPGGVVDLGVLRVGRSVPFEVRVVDASGAPLPLQIRACRPELCDGPGDLDLRIGGRANADGVTSVTWLAPGEVLVTAGGRDGLARVARLVDTAREARVELVVPPGTEVVLRGQAPARGRVYVLYDAAGQVLYGDSAVPARCTLAPGAYSLVRLDDGRETSRRSFTVGDTRTVVQIGGD